ncbi:MAG: hypothetical protein JWN88_2502 [Frankiales bacterium]|nr:hypothetical protein [Frankiales bacterium]
MGSPEQQVAWWRDARQRNRVLLITFAVLALGGILFPAFSNYLFAGDRRVVRVTMEQDAGQAAREGLKQACGGLPGVSVVPDRGNPDPRIQGRFPVRFDVKDITPAQYAALSSCIERQPRVLGTITENDGN